jgi:hypothetical protein
MENGKEPITPCTIQGRQGWGDKPTISDREVYGLTKREYFAGLAMQGMMANQGLNSYENNTIAKWSIEMADALLAELDKPKSE